MADDNEIPLQITLGNSAQQVTDLQNRIETLVTGVNKLATSFSNLPGAKDGNGPRFLKNLNQELGALVKVLQTPNADVALFNATTRGAKNVAAAVKEIDVQKLLTDARGVANALRSADPAKVQQAVEANARIIAALRFQLAESRTATASVAASQLRRMEADLRAALARETAGNARLQVFEERERVASGIAGRQRSIAVTQGFAQTPQGLAIAAEKKATEELAAVRKASFEALGTYERERNRYASITEAQFRSMGLKLQGHSLTEDRLNAEAENRNYDQVNRPPPLSTQEKYTTSARARLAGNQQLEADPQYRQDRGQLGRDQTYDKLFGDGGAALLTLQARLQLNYMAVGQLFSAFSRGAKDIVEFDNSMTKLAAVSGSSNEELGKLRTTIIDVSTGTKFSAVELADAALKLKETGLSTHEVDQSLKAIALTASSTGGTLKEVIDIYTSALEVFKLRTSESATISNQLVYALNTSRLTAETFGSSLQMVSNVAAQSGMTFSETTATLATLADQGIRAGRLLGTGMRQMLLDLDNPSEKFHARLQELGISLEDVNVKTNGLTGVLDNMKNAGFTAADALQVFQTRAANTFVAMLRGVETAKELQKNILLSGNAALTNAVQMQSLENQYKRLQNITLAVAFTMTTPFTNALKTAVGGISELTSGINTTSQSLTVMGTILSGVVVTGIGAFLVKLVVNLKSVRAGLAAVMGALEGVAVAEEGAAVAGAGLMVTLTPLLIFGAIATAVTLAIAAMSHYQEATDGLSESSEALKTKVEAAKTAQEDHAKALEAVDGFLEQITTRAKGLTNNQDSLNLTVLEAKSLFSSLSNVLDGQITTYDELISRVRSLRNELNLAHTTDLIVYGRTLDAQTAGLRNQVNQLASEGNGIQLMKSVGGHIDPWVADPETGRIESGQQPTYANYAKSLPSDIQNNPTAMAAIRMASGQSGAPTLSDINNLSNSLVRGDGGTLPPQVVDALIKALAQLATPLQQIAQNGVAGVNNARDIARGNLMATPGYQGAQSAAQQVGQALSKFSGLDTQRTTVGRDAAAEVLNDQTTTYIATIEEYLRKLSPEDRSLAQNTQLVHDLDTYKEKLREIQNGFRKVNNQTTVGMATLDLKDLDIKLKNLEKEMANSKSPAEKSAVLDQIKTIIEQTRQKALQLNKDEAQSKYGGPGGNLDLLNASLTSGALAINDQYDGLLANQTARSLNTSHHLDPNRPFDPTVNNDVRDGRLSATDISRQADLEIASSQENLKAQQAFLNAAKSTGQFPAGYIAMKQRELNGLRIQQENKEIEIRKAEVAKLDALKADMEARLKADQDRLSSLLASHGVKMDGAGNLTAGDGNFTASSRATFDKQVKELQAVIEKLKTEIPTLQNMRDQSQGKLTTLGAESDARGELSTGGIGAGFQSAVSSFQDKSGFNDSTMKTSADIFTNLIDGMDKSFATFITNFATGTMKGRDIFRQFVLSILKDALQIAANKVASSLLGAAFGSLGNLFGSGSTGMSGSFNVGADMLPAGAMTYHGGMVGRYHGGPIRRAFGGADLGRDTIPILAAPGESILDRQATRMLGSANLAALNSGAVTSRNSIPAPAAARQPDNVNVYIVDKNTQPVPGPKDILAAVHQDILTGGATKALIKSVQMGG